MIIAIDFDGTVVEHKFPEVGGDLPEAVEVLKELVAADHKLILWTVRGDSNPTNKKVPSYLDDAINWYKSHGIPLWGINKNPTQKHWSSSPKAHADVFIDDMALGCPMKYIRGVGSNEMQHVVDWKEVRNVLALRGYFGPKEQIHASGV